MWFTRTFPRKLTAEFYGTFGNLMVDSLINFCDYGELSRSQNEAIITLIEKRGKYKRDLLSWRPILPGRLIGSKAVLLRWRLIRLNASNAEIVSSLRFVCLSVALSYLKWSGKPSFDMQGPISPKVPKF